MKTILVFAAFALGTAMTHQALACEWGYHAAAQPATVVACDGSGCHAIAPSTADEQPVNDSTAAPQQVADEPANPEPTTVAELRKQ